MNGFSMKQQVLYIHGGNSYSNYVDFLNELQTMILPALNGEISMKRWSDTLREDLGEEFEFIAPSMPNKNNAKYTEWKIWFERYLEILKDGAVLVGWSQGGYFLSKYLIEETLPITIKGLILIAAPYQPADFDGEDGGDFAFDASKTELIAEKVGTIVIFHSKDDFVVPFEHAELYHRALPQAEFVVFEDRNHFLISKFPELIDKIKVISQN